MISRMCENEYQMLKTWKRERTDNEEKMWYRERMKVGKEGMKGRVRDGGENKGETGNKKY